MWKTHERLMSVERDISKAIDVFTNTIDKLENHNAKLNNLSEECVEKVGYYNRINASAIETIEHNKKIIDKIKEIVE